MRAISSVLRPFGSEILDVESKLRERNQNINSVLVSVLDVTCLCINCTEAVSQPGWLATAPPLLSEPS